MPGSEQPPQHRHAEAILDLQPQGKMTCSVFTLFSSSTSGLLGNKRSIARGRTSQIKSLWLLTSLLSAGRCCRTFTVFSIWHCCRGRQSGASDGWRSIS